MIAQHLGTLHPYEQALTIALAFGPFVVLGIVIAIRRRTERAEEQREGAEEKREGAVPDAEHLHNDISD